MKNIVDEKKLENIRFQHEYHLSKQIEQGRFMVGAILITNIVLNTITIFMGTATLLQLISQAILMVLLFVGFSWARIILAVTIALGVILSIVLVIPNMVEDVSAGWLSPLTFLGAIVIIVCQTVICVLLVTSKNIKEYLYDKRSIR